MMITVQAPASKSVSHRMVMGAALAQGDSVVSRVLESKDLERTMAILRGAGAGIVRTGEGEYAISGVGGQPHGGSVDPLSCDVHESGTTCRLLTAVLAAGMGRFRVHGAPRMHERPIGELTAALETLGVSFTFEGKPGFPPFVLKTCGLDGGEVGIGMDESSQYLSGVLLAAPLARAPLTVNIGGSKVVSWPYVGLTLQALENFGVPFSVERKEVRGVPSTGIRWSRPSRGMSVFAWFRPCTAPDATPWKATGRARPTCLPPEPSGPVPYVLKDCGRIHCRAIA